MSTEQQDQGPVQPSRSTPPRSEIKAVFERAVMDHEFRAQLISDVDRALAGYILTDAQRLLIKSLDVNDIEKLTAENLHEYFSVDSAVYVPDDMAQAPESAVATNQRIIYSIDELQDEA